MSLGVAFKGPEGIVLAADSRVTLTAERQDPSGRTMVIPATYDNATKMLEVKGQPYVGAVTYGAGAIGGPGLAPRTAHSYMPEFEQELGSDRLRVEDFASRLGEFFLNQWEASNMPEESEPMIFFVGGYDEGEAYGRVFQLSVPTAPTPIEQNPDDFGATWGGQLESTSRLLNGYDPGLPEILQSKLGLDGETTADLMNHVRAELGGKLAIPYPFLPLQDCVDLAILLIRTTAALQRFAVGVRGVGGAIDVATITRTEGFKPIQQKSITGEEASDG